MSAIPSRFQKLADQLVVFFFLFKIFPSFSLSLARAGDFIQETLSACERGAKGCGIHHGRTIEVAPFPNFFFFFFSFFSKRWGKGEDIHQSLRAAACVIDSPSPPSPRTSPLPSSAEYGNSHAWMFSSSPDEIFFCNIITPGPDLSYMLFCIL